jgi:hypothetical protein
MTVEVYNTQPAIEDEDDDDSEGHLTVVRRNTQRPERPYSIRHWRMREPQTDQQRMRSEIMQRVFTQADQSFCQRGRIAGGFSRKPIGFILVMTAPCIRQDAKHNP